MIRFRRAAPPRPAEASGSADRPWNAHAGLLAEALTALLIVLLVLGFLALLGD